MAKNEQLHLALLNDELFNRPGAQAALDAILAVDLSGDIDDPKAEAFRKAIIDHHAVFNDLGELKVAENDTNDEAFLEKANFPHSFTQLQNDAIQSRIQLGLKTANDPLLIQFSQAENPAAIRLLIKNNSSLIAPSPGKDMGTPEIVSNEMAITLKNYAQNILLQNKITAVTYSAENSERLAILGHNRKNRDERINAAKQLGFPGDIIAINQMTAEKAWLKKFAFDVSRRSAADISSQQGALRVSTAQDFCNIIGGDTILYPALLNQAKGVLGNRFLQVSIEAGKLSSKELAKIAAAETAQAAIEIFKGNAEFEEDDENPYLKHAVTDANLLALRQAAIKQLLISQIKDAQGLETDNINLSGLRNYKDYDSIRDAVKKLPLLDEEKKQIAVGLIEGTSGLGTLMVGLADIKLHLLDATPAQLKSLIDKQGLVTNFKEAFPILTNYTLSLLSDPTYANYVREQAFIGYMKTQPIEGQPSEKLRNLLPTQGNGINLNKGIRTNTLKEISKELLGFYSANDLITEAVVDSYNTYVGAELAFRDNKDKTAAELLAIIKGNAELDDSYKGIILPPEKNKLWGRLTTEYVSKLPEANIDNLSQLSKARNVGELKTALTALTMTNQDWVTPESLPAIRKAANQRLAAMQLSKHVLFGAQRPAMQAMIRHLPADKQTELLAKPEILVTLANAKNLIELKQTLNETNLPHDLSKKLLDENKFLSSIAKIHNAEIARILSLRNPLPEVDAGQISRINALLATEDAFSNQGQIRSTIAEISNIIYGNLTALEEPFKTANAAQLDDAITGPIEAQHTRNIGLLAKLKEGPELTILSAFLPVFKTDGLNQNDKTTLITAVKDKPYNNFSVMMNTEPFKTKLPNWQHHITPQVFNSLKTQLFKQQYTSNTGFFTARTKELNKQLADLGGVVDMGNTIGKSLKKLQTLHPERWFHPLQGISQNEACKIEPDVKKIAATCSTLLERLRQQKDLIQTERKSLPKLIDIDKAKHEQYVKRHRRLLEIQNVIDENIAKYEPFEKIFYGNPDADPDTIHHKGTLQVLAEAKEGNQSLVITNPNQSYIDRPLDQKNTSLGATYQPDDVTDIDRSGSAVTSSSETSDLYYKLEPAIKPGHYREHTTTYQTKGTTLHTSFIEERLSNKTTRISMAPTVGTMTNEMKVERAMSAAAQMIATLSDRKAKLVLSGHDAESVGYLWTALVLLGKNNSVRKFTAKDIIMNTTVFNPDKELGTLYGFAKTSIYNEQFKDTPATKMLVKRYEHVIGDMAGKNKKQVDEFMELRNITKKLDKEENKEATQNVAQKIEEDENYSGPRLGS